MSAPTSHHPVWGIYKPEFIFTPLATRRYVIMKYGQVDRRFTCVYIFGFRVCHISMERQD